MQLNFFLESHFSPESCDLAVQAITKRPDMQWYECFSVASYDSYSSCSSLRDGYAPSACKRVRRNHVRVDGGRGGVGRVVMVFKCHMSKVTPSALSRCSGRGLASTQSPPFLHLPHLHLISQVTEGASECGWAFAGRVPVAVEVGSAGAGEGSVVFAHTHAAGAEGRPGVCLTVQRL